MNPRDKFNNDGKNMFLHWDQMKWNNVCHWQSTINRWGSAEDRTSSRWAQSFLYKSSTQELRERVDAKYKILVPQFQGAVTYL